MGPIFHALLHPGIRALVVGLVFLQLAQAQPTVPAPESVLGNKPGDDFFLASYDESLEYFRRLDQASDKLQLVQVGQTSLGLDWHLALISSPANLSNLDRHLEIARQLAWARDLDGRQARALAQEGRAIVHIDGGLHSTEVAHAQHTIQLAYDLVSAHNDPQIDRILDEVILVLWFSINPDGQNMVVSWYRQNLGTPFEVSRLPWLYQKYVGHDNNRDGYMNNMLESQVITQTTLRFNPQVFYNHHQAAPFPTRIWIPPFAEPVSRNTHPLMWRWVNLFGTNMAAYLDQNGMPGATHRGRGFDDWYPGFIDHVNNFRNTVSFLTETALYRYATPHFYTVNDFPQNRRDLRPEALYSSPWKGGWWRLGDAVKYMLGASMSVLDLASKSRQDLLYNRYQAGRDVIARFSDNPPYAYVIPQQQDDPQTAALLVERMRFSGLEIHQATDDFTANGRRFAAGTWVIFMNQAFAALVKEIFEVQDYPDLRDFPEGPPDLPYDVAGWTLPLQMGVETVAVLTPISPQDRAGGFVPLEQVVPPPGNLRGSGTQAAFSHRSNASIRALNQVLAAGGQAGFDLEGDRIVASGVDRDRFEQVAQSNFVPMTLLREAPASVVPVKAPRVGLYRPWVASIDEGWTRWILEDYGFNLESVYNADVQAGRLEERFDTLVIADMRPRAILQGNAVGTTREKYVGGIGANGLQNLIDFVKQGGTLVTFNNASRFAIEQLQLPVKNVLKDLKNTEFFCSGSILKAELTDPSHPLTTGLLTDFSLVFQRGPAFEPEPSFKGTVLVRYPKSRNPLLSGFILKPEKIQGKAAMLEVELGEGRVILFGFRPQWRGQSHGTYRLIFNSLYYFGAAAQRDKPAGQQAHNFKLQAWKDLKQTIRTDLKDLIQGNREFGSARGNQALRARDRLDALVENFQKERLAAISELKKATIDSRLKDHLSAYTSQLKNLLVDIRNRDLSSVDYGVQDLVKHYRLEDLEKTITQEIAVR